MRPKKAREAQKKLTPELALEQKAVRALYVHFQENQSEEYTAAAKKLNVNLELAGLSPVLRESDRPDECPSRGSPGEEARLR